MTKYNWVVNDKQTHQWAWFSLETANGVYEVTPLLHSTVGERHEYSFEVSFRGKMVLITKPVAVDKIKLGRRAGQLAAQQHFEGKLNPE